MNNDEIIQREIEEIGQLPIVNKILELICKTTGMRFAAVAKITSEKWIALAVVDNLNYGVQPGDQLDLFNTLCNDVKRTEVAVVIDDASIDETYKDNEIPRNFGFTSHISVPIFRGDESFYGTLCAVDPEPNDLKNEKTLTLFSFLSELISEHLETVDLLRSSKKDLKKQLKISSTLESLINSRTADLKKNVRELARSNQELKDFSYIASHDLQEPLRKIQTYVSMISQKEGNALSDSAASYVGRIQNAVDRMRQLINDLLAYSVVQTAPTIFEPVDLNAMLSEVVETLSEEIGKRSATVSIDVSCTVVAYAYQIRQLFQNLIGNSLKYSSESRLPVIVVTSKLIWGRDGGKDFEPDVQYCEISIKDNGIGFEQQNAKKIFKVFERLHGKTAYSGTGIGLAIVKKIIENHRGFISVAGVPNVGAEFKVFLPVVNDPNLNVDLTI